MRRVTLTLNCILLACIGLVCFVNYPAIASQEKCPGGLTVDLGNMPPEWQTSICLPDDPYKSMVDKSGDLLYHYLRIVGGTDRFHTRIAIRVADDAVWQKQQLHSVLLPYRQLLFQLEDQLQERQYLLH